jgi:hypothetical protein
MDERPLNSASEKDVREQKKRTAFTRRAELDDYRAILKTPQGRRLFWRIIAKAGVYQQVDIEHTNRVLVHEGKRSIGLWLLAELETAHPGARDLCRAEFLQENPA